MMRDFGRCDMIFQGMGTLTVKSKKAFILPTTLRSRPNNQRNRRNTRNRPHSVKIDGGTITIDAGGRHQIDFPDKSTKGCQD